MSDGYSLDLGLVKLGPANYCFYKNNYFKIIVQCGPTKHLVLLVVSCRNEDTWSGKCLG